MGKVSKDKQTEYDVRYREKNRESIRARMNAWNRKNKDKRRHYALKENYGIGLDQYNDMLKQQNECCKICNQHKDLFDRALAVDHCHATGKVRGLLCKNCNMMLGKAKERIDVLKAAIKYLEES